ncbi:hypothetical protein H6P81_012677 [Aristolochia fimbriata]|uniref:Alpha-galactosidase n=1 Tax=Aristolochia fimbriata TaxID=158543 RepID=A0AAV7ED27_ARIFI|nr:hypothetical protein H6P81_012677 [Aristolochia fimbriata]
MGAFSWSFIFFFFFGFLLLRGSLIAAQDNARQPPRGWNSYDSFSWIISEEEFLQNAEIVSKKLLPYGYQYVVVDFLWYRKKGPGAYTDSSGDDVIDEWGRPIPDPGRWPSASDAKGFMNIAQKVHEMGLKFGIHVMRGISAQAVNASTPILDTQTGQAYMESGRKWTAKDIGMTERACAWMPHGFMSVNTESGAGKAFLRSLYQQYAEWGVDFVKHDCIFGDDLDVKEISIVSEALKELDRPVIYSLSPGTSAAPGMAKEVAKFVNMYRVTADDWDRWEDVESHFNVARDFAASNLIGANGLKGKSWPDLDMLPLGWLTDPSVNEGPHRTCRLNPDEQKTQMTLWSIAKSPLMFGGDLTHIDQSTLSLITHPILLEINSFSTNNKEFPYIRASKGIGRSNCIFTNKWGNFKNATMSDETELAVTSCKEHHAKGWSLKMSDQKLDQVCWRESLGKNNRKPFCLYKQRSYLAVDESLIQKKQYEGKFHLVAMDKLKYCLDASTNRKFSLHKYRTNFLSPCRWDVKQSWDLNANGTLVSSYSGLCASVKTVKGNANVGGVRSWVATGRKGEVYLSFFNLNAASTVISANIADLAKSVPSDYVRKDTCKCTEVWSAKDLGTIKQLSMEVAGHGCALFVLNCQ